MGPWRRTLACLLWLGFATESLSQPFTLNYSGRLTAGSGKPVDGPVDLEFKFCRNATGGLAIGISPVMFYDVPRIAGSARWAMIPASTND